MIDYLVFCCWRVARLEDAIERVFNFCITVVLYSKGATHPCTIHLVPPFSVFHLSYMSNIVMLDLSVLKSHSGLVGQVGPSNPPRHKPQILRNDISNSDVEMHFLSSLYLSSAGYLLGTPNMTNIKNVAIIGGSGNLGREVVKAVLASGFNVTALTRSTSTSKFPSGVRVYQTDYSSESSLADAFAGQDAVVSVIATAALGSQLAIIPAAAKAGVKRFIPSEFGVNAVRLEDGGIKTILGAKVKARELLERIAGENSEFTWTGISTNLFFDWVCFLILSCYG